MSRFVLHGSGFSYLPSNIVGVRSNDNNDPLVQRYSTADTQVYHVESKTDNELVLALSVVSMPQAPAYFGALLSNDRSTIYWLNETQPLP